MGPAYAGRSCSSQQGSLWAPPPTGVGSCSPTPGPACVTVPTRGASPRISLLGFYMPLSTHRAQPWCPPHAGPPAPHSASVNLNCLRRKHQEKPGARKQEPRGQSSPQPGARLKGHHAFLAWPPVHTCGSIHTVLVYPPCLSTSMHLGSTL